MSQLERLGEGRRVFSAGCLSRRVLVSARQGNCSPEKEKERGKDSLLDTVWVLYLGLSSVNVGHHGAIPALGWYER